MNLQTILVLIPILVVPWIVVYFVFFRTNKKVLSNYNKLKEKYGLELNLEKKVGMKNHPSAHGLYRNRQIKIESVVIDSLDGQKVTPHTVLTVDCPNTEGFLFNVVKRNKKNAVKFASGAVLLDDNEFDNIFLVQSNNPDKIKKLFDFNTKFKLDRVNALGFNGIISLKGNSLSYTERNLLESDEDLMRAELVMHEMCDIAEIMRLT